MVSRIRPPRTIDGRVVIRLAQSPQEIEAANRLVYQNYVEEGFWEDDRKIFDTNRYLHSPCRRVCVISAKNRVIGTGSIIMDSINGLPSDSFRQDSMRQLRKTGDRMAEVSALAIDKLSSYHRKNLILFLIKFIMQYSFYYAGIDRFVVACQPKHAVFYRSIIRFNSVGSLAYCAYAKRVAQLLTLDLLEAHKLLSEHYESPRDKTHNFYRFMLVDEHPNLQFPPKYGMKRSRETDWLDCAYRRHEKPAKAANF